MAKWFERIDPAVPGAINSRVRLVRNCKEYVFPSRLSDKDSEIMVHRLEQGLRNVGEVDGKDYHYAYLREIKELDKKILRERRILNSTIAAKKTPAGVFISEDEESSIVLNGTDHFRIQLLSCGNHLEELWQQADRLDDYINERFAYAYDQKYGYLTSYPTNTGTGMRASVILHLPTLSLGKRFQGMVMEMSRFGAVIKGVYGTGNENYGSLYQISNLKTLGTTEKEILDRVNKVSEQLLAQERQIRRMTMEKRGLECEDEAYKSYGVLKYARRLAAKEAMIFLSQLMSGINDGILKLKEPCSIYRLMLGIQPANLQKLSDHPLGKEELEVARATYLRAELPEMLE